MFNKIKVASLIKIKLQEKKLAWVAKDYSELSRQPWLTFILYKVEQYDQYFITSESVNLST